MHFSQRIGIVPASKLAQRESNNGRTVVILLIDPGREAPFVIRDIAARK